MKKLNAAMVNQSWYCKFPDGINCIEQFIQFLNKNYHSLVELELFIDDGCVAPFFIEEDLKTEKQYWNPSNLRVVKAGEVFLLSRHEYEEKLEKVISEKCVHCVNYSEDECKEDFKSHIEHIDLNGECFGFEKKE